MKHGNPDANRSHTCTKKVVKNNANPEGKGPQRSEEGGWRSCTRQPNHTTQQSCKCNHHFEAAHKALKKVRQHEHST